MIRRFFKGVATLALAAAILPVSAAKPTSFSYNGMSAYGLVSSTEGCVKTDVFILGAEETTPGNSKNDGGVGAMAGPSTGATVYISRYDICNQTTLMGMSGMTTELPEVSFDVSRQLTTARLNTTIDAYDWSSNHAVPITVDVTWTGSGELNRTNDHYRYHGDGMMITTHYHGISRHAEVSGSVSDGTTNFIEGDTGYGTLMDTHGGTLVIE